jgi:hypothetical protein
VALLTSSLLADSRHRETVVRFWLIATSTGISYFLLDVVAGFLLIKPISPDLVVDGYRHHKLVANSVSRIEQREFAYLMRVNNAGLRGRDIDVIKKPGSYRILMLGDSFTMGKGVRDEETFSALLDTALKAKSLACGGPPIEVLNGGVDSYTPILSLIQLRSELVHLQPDLVILNLDVSDLAQEQRYRAVAEFGPDGEVIRVAGREPTSVTITDRLRSWIERHMFFTRAALVYVNKAFSYWDLSQPDVLTQASAEITDYTLESDSLPREKQWEDLFDSILRMKRFAEERKMGFALAIYPWPHEYSDSAWIPGRYSFMPKGARASTKRAETITVLAAEHHIELINLFPVFREYSGSDKLYFDHDMHWTRGGQALAARGMQAALEAGHLQGWCGQAALTRPRASGRS